MRGWITALRIARREARRAKGRSLLVLVMIGLPVMCLAFAAASYDMFTLTTQERLDRRLGTADALIEWYGSGEVTQTPDGRSTGLVGPPGEQDGATRQKELLTLLPAGTRLLPLGATELDVRTPSGIGRVAAMTGDIGDPLMRGIVSTVEGTAPKRADEVSLNAAAAEWLDVRVGDAIKAVDPDRHFTVTAIVEYPDDLTSLAIFPAAARESLGVSDGRWLADTPAPVDWAQIKQLNKKGVVIASRAVVLDPPPASEYEDYSSDPNPQQFAIGGVIVGLVILEIVLLAGPAFAVGARRRARDLALVAAAGGEPKHLRRIVLADGVVLGFGGAACGLVLGVGLALVGRPLLEELLIYRSAGGYRVFPSALLGIALLAIMIGLLAAVVPAFTAARQSVVLALAGRRGIVKSRKRWIVAGLVLASSGAAIAVFGAFQVNEMVILAGIILTEFGLVLVTPALIGLISRFGRWLPLAPRLALRDTARNRSSAAPAISAIMAAVAGAVAVGVFLDGQARQATMTYVQTLPIGYVQVQDNTAPEGTTVDWAQVEAAVSGTLQDSDPHRYSGVVCPGGQPVDGNTGNSCGLIPVLPIERRCPYFLRGQQMTEADLKAAEADERCHDNSVYGGIVVDDGASIAVFSGADPGHIAEAQRVLGRGGAVVHDPKLVKDGRVTFQVYSGQDWSKMGPDDLPTISVEGYHLGSGWPAAWAYVSPKMVAQTPLAIVPGGLIMATQRPPTAAEQERLTLLVREFLGADGAVRIERGPEARPNPIGLILALVAAVIALGAAGAATGLAAADSRAHLGTLAAVGAAPRVRRRLSLSQAGVTSALGALLGTLTGFGVAAVLIATVNRLDEQAVYRMAKPPPIPLGVPWDTIAILLAVPLVAMAGAGLLTRSRLPIERRL